MLAPRANSAQPPIRVPQIDIDLRQLYADSLFWLSNHWLRILIAIGVALLIMAAVRAVRHFGTALCNRDRADRLGWWKVAGRTLARTGHFFTIMLALHLAAGIADPPVQLAAFIKALFTIAAVFQVAIWARELILGAVEHRTTSENYTGEALTNAISIIRLLVTIAVFAVAFIVVLDNLGVNVTGLIAGLGVGGIAIGLAAQGIFADLFAALAILFDRPFRRGDVIGYDNTTGTVEEIGLKSTRIRPPSGEEHIIANKQLLEKEIRNISRRDYRRITFTLGVAQWTPIETLRRLPAILQEEVEAAGQQFARAGFINFGTSSFEFDLEFDSPSPGFEPFFAARHEVALRVIARLAAEKIDLAYPTQTTFTAAPDGTMIMPYAEVQAVKRIDLKNDER